MQYINKLHFGNLNDRTAKVLEASLSRFNFLKFTPLLSFKIAELTIKHTS